MNLPNTVIIAFYLTFDIFLKTSFKYQYDIILLYLIHNVLCWQYRSSSLRQMVITQVLRILSLQSWT